MTGPHHPPLVVTNAEVPTRLPDPEPLGVTPQDNLLKPATRLLDVRIVDGVVAAVGTDLALPGDRRMDAGGRALLSGLHDHHLHLMAMAAAERSLDVSGLSNPHAFDRALREVAVGTDDRPGWLRVIGLDDHHGAVDRHRLDALVPRRPVRVQHRSGAAWVVNSVGLDAVGLTDLAPTGWVYRADRQLADRWASHDTPPDLGAIGRRLASLGVTGVTDATPSTEAGDLDALADARRRRLLPQRVVAMGGPPLADTAFPPELGRGPVKVIVADQSLPSTAELVAAFRSARRAGRNVAVHCVTRVALVLALTAWEDVGPQPGDRIEHGSVIPVELLATLRHLGITVVTQPAFIHARGDRYLSDVDDDDVDHLYRCGSLLRSGIGVGGSTDAPFGPDDPWLAMATMVWRRTGKGAELTPDEAVHPAVALARFQSPPHDPGGPPRVIAPGVPADLFLADRPLRDVLADPGAVGVEVTWVGGEIVHGDADC